ncbi:MAG TPA: hypothetical protein VMZ29_09470 [Candidatus Bathyarchaeia archaeon]|nr:hypothetical protein [Candidatus Bathyarchaeia archaeon]
MTEKLSNEQLIAQTKEVTKKLLSLPETFTLKNGWKLRELYLHLWSWDDEMIKACEAKINDDLEGFQFDHQMLGMKYTEWNDTIIEQKSNLSLKDAKTLFSNTRKKLISLYEKISNMPETVDDEKSFFRTENLLTISEHDKHHLDQASEIKD